MLRSVYLYLIEKLKPFSFYLDGILHIFFPIFDCWEHDVYIDFPNYSWIYTKKININAKLYVIQLLRI